MSALDELANEQNWDTKLEYGPYGGNYVYNWIGDREPDYEQAAAELAALRRAAEAKHDAMVIMAMFLTNVNTINEQSQVRLIQHLLDAGEQTIADAIAEGGFAAALEKLEGDK